MINIKENITYNLKDLNSSPKEVNKICRFGTKVIFGYFKFKLDNIW